MKSGCCSELAKTVIAAGGRMTQADGDSRDQSHVGWPYIVLNSEL